MCESRIPLGSSAFCVPQEKYPFAVQGFRGTLILCMRNFRNVCSCDVVRRVENHFISFFQVSRHAYSFGNLTQANLTQFNILKEKKKKAVV